MLMNTVGCFLYAWYGPIRVCVGSKSIYHRGTAPAGSAAPSTMLWQRPERSAGILYLRIDGWLPWQHFPANAEGVGVHMYVGGATSSDPTQGALGMLDDVRAMTHRLCTT